MAEGETGTGGKGKEFMSRTMGAADFQTIKHKSNEFSIKNSSKSTTRRISDAKHKHMQ